MYVVAYETSSKTGNFLLDRVSSMDNVCNRCLFSKVKLFVIVGRGGGGGSIEIIPQ